MANFVIAGDTSGTVTLQAPAVSGTTTLTLPTTSGTVLTTAASQTLTTPNVIGPLTLTSGGITFNANPGGGTQATLNDYEIGTWTPNVGGTATYTTQAGSYIKVGNMVTATFGMSINVIGTGSTTSLSGFPFTCINITAIYPAGAICYFNALNASITSIAAQLQVNTTTATFATTAAASAGITNTTAIFKSGATLYGTITYQTN